MKMQDASFGERISYKWFSRQGLVAPFFDDLAELNCAKYARLAAEILSGTIYSPASAWNLAKRNQLIKRITESGLDAYQKLRALGIEDLLIPKKTIVTFYNPHSRFNEKDKECTHATLVLRGGSSPVFCHQYVKKQEIVSADELFELGLDPCQVLAPNNL